MSYEDGEPERQEERELRRWNIPIPVIIRGIRSDGSEFDEETITTDAGPSGMCVLLTVPLRSGDKVTVMAPEEDFSSPATVRDVNGMGPNINRVRVTFAKGKSFNRESAAKKYVYDYQMGVWVGYMLEGTYYNSKHEPFGKVEENRILDIDSGEKVFLIRGDRVYDERMNCIGHII
jgi:hypothetical protein